MANGWTSARRAKQAQAIRTWRPWEHSTGPRTPEGKARAAGNAERFHGWTPELKAERDNVRAFARHAAELLREHRELLRKVLG
jgi:hypothetical protein